jgi:SAM-dependent methyltransferase
VGKSGDEARLRALNLGCGERFHPEWVNLDLNPASPSVQKWDLRYGLQFPNDSFHLVYHSHVLEHLPRKLGKNMLKECLRVLRPGGVIRVVVPDLEEAAREYLQALEKAAKGMAGWGDNYNWIVVELLDQAVRESPGGAWYEYLRQDPIPNWEFIVQRAGPEAERAMAVARGGANDRKSAPERIRAKWAYIVKNPAGVIRNKLAKTFLNQADYEALQIGRFRRQGEIHQWMYDGYSLGKLLEEVGFTSSVRCTARDSQIGNWIEYGLDVEPDGRIYKPGSLYMEARKK